MSFRIDPNLKKYQVLTEQIYHALRDSAKVCSEVFIIEPRMAKWLLRWNLHNRPMRPNKINALVKDILEGRWILTHQGICFSTGGTLLDGQNRLAAFQKANVPVPSNVSFGVETAAQAAMDIQSLRSLSDRAMLDEVPGAHHQICSTIRAMYIGKPKSESNLTDMEWIDKVKKHYPAARFAQHAMNPFVKKVCVAPVKAVIARAWYSQEPEQLEAFCRIMTTGLNNSCGTEGAIPMLLSRWLMLDGYSRNMDGRLEQYRKTERALDAFLKKEPLTKIYTAKQELFPLPEELMDKTKENGKVI